MAQKQTKKAEQGKEPLKCTFGNCENLQFGDGEYCKKHAQIKKYSFDDLDWGELRDVLVAYNEYIQDANETDKFSTGWRPVCIDEFFENDYKAN